MGAEMSASAKDRQPSPEGRADESSILHRPPVAAGCMVRCFALPAEVTPAAEAMPPTTPPPPHAGPEEETSQVEAFEERFLSEFVRMLESGLRVKKHASGMGRARKRTLRLDDGRLAWSHDAEGSVPVTQVLDVRVGDFGQGKPVPHNVDPARCLCLVTKLRTVNLELADGEVRDLCADGFGLLIAHFREHAPDALDSPDTSEDSCDGLTADDPAATFELDEPPSADVRVVLNV